MNEVFVVLLHNLFISDNNRTFLLLYNLDTMDDEFFFKKDVLLRCRGDDLNSNVTWLKNGTKVSELNSLGKTQFVEHNNGDLKIIHPSKSTFSLMCLMTAFETGLPFCLSATFSQHDLLMRERTIR